MIVGRPDRLCVQSRRVENGNVAGKVFEDAGSDQYWRLGSFGGATTKVLWGKDVASVREVVHAAGSKG